MNVVVEEERAHKQPRPIYGVYYIGCLGHYLSIVKEQMKCLVDSGLYAQTTKIVVFICSFNENDTSLLGIIEEYDTEKKCVLITTAENVYEKFAINNYTSRIQEQQQQQQDASAPYYVYYFHTKAVSRGPDTVFDRRRKILNYYTLVLHKLNLELLETYDAVGCSLTTRPSLHFSGNFWWAKSEHVCTLPPSGDEYLDPEMYICKTHGNYISLSQATNDGNVEYHITRTEEVVRRELTSNPI